MPFKILDPGSCPHVDDLGLTDVTSKAQMERKGWQFEQDMTHMYSGFQENCGTETWYGYQYSAKTGSINATFLGSGTATLDYGSCTPYDGKTNVYLNEEILGTADQNSPSKRLTFDFSPGDVLKIEEVNIGIIKLNSLQLNCKGD